MRTLPRKSALSQSPTRTSLSRKRWTGCGRTSSNIAKNLATFGRSVAKRRLPQALDGLSDGPVWAEIERRKSGVAPEHKSIKQTEIETLLTQKDTLGEDKPEGDFYARTHPMGAVPPGVENKLDRLVLVHRLREVVAQIGFTRFDATFPDIDGELDLDIELAPLSREPHMVARLSKPRRRGVSFLLQGSDCRVATAAGGEGPPG